MRKRRENNRIGQDRTGQDEDWMSRSVSGVILITWGGGG
jgi:hypothetical protein